MDNVDFEVGLIKRYGNGRIPREDMERMLGEAVSSGVLEREEVGEYDRDREYDVSELLELIRKWRTEFLRESFSINDMCTYEGNDVHVRNTCPSGEETLGGHGRDESPKDSFVTTDEAFLSSLRDKTRIITERGSISNKKIVRSVLRAWKEYEEQPVKRKTRHWYLLLILLIPLYFLYVPKPF